MLTLYDCATHSLGTATADQVRARVGARQLGFWLDIENPGEPEYALLAEAFRFHPLTIEDVRHQNQRAKLDDYDGYSFMVMFTADWSAGVLRFREHHLYLGEHLLVTVHEQPEPALDRIRERLGDSHQDKPQLLQFVTYLVADALVDNVFDVLVRIDGAADELQDRALARSRPDTLASITGLRRDVAILRRQLAAERDMFQRLVTQALQDPDHGMTLYYRDVYDHVVRQYEQADGIRDLLGGAMDVYLSTVSNRLNETMRALTAIASLFLPLTFLTGFFGQNFGWLIGRIGSLPAFSVGLSLMAASVVLQLYLFRRRGWI